MALSDKDVSALRLCDRVHFIYSAGAARIAALRKYPPTNDPFAAGEPTERAITIDAGFDVPDTATDCQADLDSDSPFWKVAMRSIKAGYDLTLCWTDGNDDRDDTFSLVVTANGERKSTSHFMLGHGDLVDGDADTA